MLSINNLSIQFGDKHLFKDVSVRVHAKNRIGLAGVNGTGKSTLLKIMANIKVMDDGIVSRTKQSTVGYLPQEITSFPPGRSLYEEAETAFVEVLCLKSELAAINKRLTLVDQKSADCQKLLIKQGTLQHTLEQLDIFRIKSTIEKVLTGLGFTTDDFIRDCHSFSGGWLMRLMLAKLLLINPSLLLLDEPTNHLDISSLTWLEEFLVNYQGAIVVISHDRIFLDAITTVTWELSLGKLTVYAGNYTKYQQEKEQRLSIQKAAYDNQQAKIEQTMRFVRRFRAKSTKASQVQSRLKQLDKMELAELEDYDRVVSFSFPPPPASGRLVVEIDKLGKDYNGKLVFNDISFQLQRGEKMAVVGANGAGKSTLAKLLAGLILPDRGMVKLGHNVKLSYFGQHQAQELERSRTAFDTLYHAADNMTITQARSLLGTFLFRGDEVDKKVAVLSGGEKSRLALAKMIASPANLLIMDEPTNHLDMTSQEILQKAMQRYDGGIIVISHNRYFLNSFVDKVLEIKDHHAILHEGNIDDYLMRMKAAETEDKARSLNDNRDKLSGKPVNLKKGKAIRQAQAKKRQVKSTQLAPLKKIVLKTEKEIEKLEAEKVVFEKILADPDLYKQQELFSEKSRAYQQIEKLLLNAYSAWEQAQSKIEECEESWKE